MDRLRLGVAMERDSIGGKRQDGGVGGGMWAAGGGGNEASWKYGLSTLILRIGGYSHGGFSHGIRGIIVDLPEAGKVPW